MAVTSRAVVELVLLGPTHDRRQLQDSPILGDVWAEFAAKPQACIDLLISPYKTQAAGPVALRIARRLTEVDSEHPPGQEAHVAYLQGIVAARLFFWEVLRVVVPMTNWWHDPRIVKQMQENADTGKLLGIIELIWKWAQSNDPDEQNEIAHEIVRFSTLTRYLALAALILEAGRAAKLNGKGIGGLLGRRFKPKETAERMQTQLATLLSDAPQDPSVWQVSLNRKAMPALERSVPAVKGDAAKALFKVKCDEIAWAILDSGIDSTHPALLDANGKSRVIRTFDFSHIREVVSLDNLALNKKKLTAKDKQRIARLIRDKTPSEKEIADAAAKLKKLAEDADNDRAIDWSLVASFVEIENPRGTRPANSHGTHVAGILGARGDEDRYHDGMCPDIKLYDFRVLGRTLQDTEFAIIAALQYVRYMNDRNTFIAVHGANLSLSIPHDVRNFACGRTPVCNECERLVDSGVVVVAAAGNFGYHSFETKDGSYEGYTAFSITDPGNADGVITVGATHRFWPHTYGVSFFSSRGPTGDGRMKPDLVAPGERIQSCLLDSEWGELDGTSMAAPHVSGAAAMLMGRYSELVGQPRRIKRILCETATDLGRERSFQGHGMLDVLRAFQGT